MFKRSILTIAVLFLALTSTAVAQSKSDWDWPEWKPGFEKPPAEQEQALTPASFTVGAGKVRSFCFRSTGEVNRIAGRWRAEGGSRNDIHVMLIDAEELENLENDNKVPTYYNRKATTGRIDVRLKAGEYCLVFDNSGSIISNKAVTSTISGY
jgi:hypothetical protein